LVTLICSGSNKSSRRLEREAGRNVELMWLLERLAPDFKTIADFRKDNHFFHDYFSSSTISILIEIVFSFQYPILTNSR
jgi:hypothetical protein